MGNGRQFIGIDVGKEDMTALAHMRLRGKEADILMIDHEEPFSERHMHIWGRDGKLIHVNDSRDVVTLGHGTPEYQRISRFMAGEITELTAIEKRMACLIAEENLKATPFSESPGAQSIRPVNSGHRHPYSPHKQDRTKVLAKRAKNKANRKKARK